ncbi:DMT family transporter [Seohaeicola zhoushanensis]|uniref:EamA domain-containing protein n=1 Tax=Seohaeicola zhoushanensis TaxID=1569283 RepID=A0A8J3GTB8_9RHOB|nr:DMT family transporter [Seohaeicola zhoushanensis]GHF32731.1 hypothetical protein GCM10017056_00110 [Seohaeicola zhoushanensis]
MTRRDIALYSLVLVLAGMGWGMTQPLGKIAVSTGHQHFGLIFWQCAIGAAVMALVSVLQGHRLPLHRGALLTYLVIALLGTVIPNSTFYTSIAHLPSGVMSIVISLVPMMAFPIALGLKLERFSARRLFGLLAGLAGVMLLVVPEASLPDPAMLVWVPLALVGPFFYACEGNYVARFGTADVDPIRVLFGASLAGALLTLPMALGSGQFISPLRSYGPPEFALILSAVLNVFIYAAYVWLVGRAGAVFAMQVAYLVTGFGMLWAMAILSESYSPYIWAAMGLVLLGVMLVQPRRNEAVAAGAAIEETGLR